MSRFVWFAEFVLIAVAFLAIACTIGVGCGLVRGPWPSDEHPWLISCVALFSLYAAWWGLRRLVPRWRWKQLRRRHEGARRWIGEIPGFPQCPNCRDTHIVQGPYTTRFWESEQGPVARCLTCGYRGAIGRCQWRRLPESSLGDPHETLSDKADHLVHDTMTRGQIVLCVGGLFLGPVVVALAASSLASDPRFGGLGGVLGFPGGIVGGWYLGRWLFPPRKKPGLRCIRCGYDLRWLSGDRCPECGPPSIHMWWPLTRTVCRAVSRRMADRGRMRTEHQLAAGPRRTAGESCASSSSEWGSFSCLPPSGPPSESLQAQPRAKAPNRLGNG